MNSAGKTPPLFVGLAVGIATTVTAFALGAIIVSIVGRSTNSGLLGICGPYGDASEILFLISGASLVVSPIVGTVCGLLAHSRMSRRRMKQP